MSVNVAAGELSRGALVERVTRCLARIDIDPACLILEVTENAVLENLHAAITTFDALQRAGVHVAIDDVGTGYTSLAYLRRLPIDILKIARPLVAELGDPNSSGELARTVVRHGEALRLALVAEGVELPLQVERLNELGCSMAQGFHLARPCEAGAMEALLRQGGLDPAAVHAHRSARTRCDETQARPAAAGTLSGCTSATPCVSWPSPRRTRRGPWSSGRTPRPGTLTAEVKSPGDYVTEVDRSAEQAAIRVLRAGAPDIAILAEESGGTRHDRMWVIDPVDGTTNFVRGFPVVGVSVALVENGRPVIGAVNAPLLGDAWSAAEGEGRLRSQGQPSDGLDAPWRGCGRHRIPVPPQGTPSPLPAGDDPGARALRGSSPSRGREPRPRLRRRGCVRRLLRARPRSLGHRGRRTAGSRGGWRGHRLGR